MNKIKKNRIIKSFRENCEKFGFDPKEIKIEFSNRLRVTAGVAIVREKKIKLNKRMFVLYDNDGKELEKTLLHELAHIIDYWKNYAEKESSYSGNYHGLSWKIIMLKMGLKPKKYHNLPVSNYKRYCNPSCRANGMTLSEIQAKRAISGESRYRCKICKKTITVKEVN